MYLETLLVLSLILFTIILLSSNDHAHHGLDFDRRQFTYCSVYLLATTGDWLQGPHVYVLYESYGFEKRRIEALFMAGFGTSLIAGFVAGPLVDIYGRRRGCLWYGMVYSVACLLKNSTSFGALLLGRFLAGIATSLLFTAFESWVVCQFQKDTLDALLLNDLLANAAFINSMVAIMAGVVAQLLADSYGYVAPFNASVLVFTAMSLIALLLWEENYGSPDRTLTDTLQSSWRVIRSRSEILQLGIVQSLFESVMYVFVLEWTPMLQSVETVNVPHGIVFSCFMVAMAIGSAMLKTLARRYNTTLILGYVLTLSLLSFVLPLIYDAIFIVFPCMIVFEFCIGMFLPAIGYLRGHLLPEAYRSTIMNLFRVPLNLLVVFILLMDLRHQYLEAYCVLALTVSLTALLHMQPKESVVNCVEEVK